jgi:hypothetical protein
MESPVQTDCWQTSLIDHTFYCSADYWQWSNGAHAQSRITSTTEFRWDYSFCVGYKKWMMLSLPSTQFPRWEQNHHLDFIDKQRVESRQIVDKLHRLFTHFIVLQSTDNDLMVLMPGWPCVWSAKNRVEGRRTPFDEGRPKVPSSIRFLRFLREANA